MNLSMSSNSFFWVTLAYRCVIIEALRGNRLMLRAVGLTEKELSILGVAHAGE